MQLWLSQYLSTLVKIPVALLVLVAVLETIRAVNQFNDAQYTRDLEYVLELTTAASHEIQKERGMSAGFVGSKGQKFTAKLPNQRKKLDSTLEPLLSFIDDSEFDEETQKSLDTFKSNMSELSNIRRQVSQQKISVPDLLKFYTGSNLLLIELSTIAAHHVDDRRTSQQFETLYSLSSIKENAGIERAVLSNVFGRGSFNPASYIRFIELRTAQNTFLHTAELLADKQYLETLKEFRSSPETKEVYRYRDIALSGSNGFDVNPEEWFEAATQRIKLLREDELTLLEQIKFHADELRSASTNLLILEAILLIVTLYLAFVITRSLNMSKRQTQELGKVMKGVVNHRDLTRSVKIVSNDELGLVAEQLNETLASIKEDFSNFQQSAMEVAAASNESSYATDSSRQGLHEMGEKVSQLAYTSRELNNGVASDVEQISQAAVMAEEVAESAREGVKVVKEAVTEIKATSVEVDSVGEAIEALSDKVNDILGMVEVIRSVAEQTNLLALNAAIEAARAGEQGRGFAVVADEVRALAQRTQDSTTDISHIVDELMTRSKEAFSTIERGREKSTQAVSMVSSIDEVLSGTTEKMQELNTLTANILDSAHRQLDQISGIDTGVASIDETAANNVRMTEEVAAASTQVASQADIMLQKVESYKL